MRCIGRYALETGFKVVKIGSLCTGYGGLDMAVELYFNAETVWVSEIDKYAAKVIDQRIKKPNLGDLKVINWAEVEPIDILTAGYPCQPFSTAGLRKGADDERHLWPYILKAISVLRPQYVILENVRGHLTLGFKEVLADLTECGYDVRWRIVRASDVGAPHQRARLFIIAYPNSAGSQRPRYEANDVTYGTTTDTNGYARTQPRRTDRGISSAGETILNRSDRQVYGCSDPITERKVPPALDQSERLNTQFVEYIMGLPEGWVTDTGLSRTQQLKMLGNGVVPQQAYHAISLIMDTVNNL